MSLDKQKISKINKKKEKEQKHKWGYAIYFTIYKKTKIFQTTNIIIRIQYNLLPKKKKKSLIFDQFSSYKTRDTIKFFKMIQMIKTSIQFGELFLQIQNLKDFYKYKQASIKFLTFIQMTQNFQLQSVFYQINKIIPKLQFFPNKTKIMSDYSLNKLNFRLNSPEALSQIAKTFKFKQIKLSKKIYNIQSRNITKFIKQCSEIQRKTKARDNIKLAKIIQSSKKYDQNELLQLKYQITKNYKTPIYFHHRAKTQGHDLEKGKNTINDFKQQKLRKKEKIANNNKVTIDINHNQFNQKAINFRKRHSQITKSSQFHVGIKLPTNFLRGMNQHNNFQDSQNNKNLKKLTTSIVKKQNQRKSVIKIQKFVQITQNKMNRYLTALSSLSKYNFNQQNINESKINNLILQRYSISNANKLKDAFQQQNNLNPRFFLPFMQFISISQTRKSIHRIINMSIKNCQKICFSLMDFNQNGFIDQKDLINFVQLTEKYPILELDLKKIAYFIQKQKLKDNSQFDSFQDQNCLDACKKINKAQQLSHSVYQAVNQLISKKQQSQFNASLEYESSENKQVKYMQKIQSENTRDCIYLNENNKDNFVSNKAISDGAPCSFNRKAHFSFLQSKQNFKKIRKINNNKLKIKINLDCFYKIFAEKRPSLFFDLIVFLFGVKIQDLINPDFIQKEYTLDKIKLTNFFSNDNIESFRNYNVNKIIQQYKKKSQPNMQDQKWNK